MSIQFVFIPLLLSSFMSHKISTLEFFFSGLANAEDREKIKRKLKKRKVRK